MKAKSIRFINVSKDYGQSLAVNNISFEVKEGTLVTLLGPSGCGKTTTLRMIAGLEIATQGKIYIGEEEVTHLPASERDVSMVFQSYALFPHMNVFDNVAYGLKVKKFSKEHIAEKVDKALATIGLSGYQQRLPSELSGGQQQRVAVARALVLEPSVLLFDEPLSNLDAKLRRQMREEIRDLQQRLTLTVVYVTHDQSEAMAVSDKIIVMNKSVIAQEGSPRELYRQPINDFVAGFIGDANLLKGQLENSSGKALVRISGVALPLEKTTLPAGAVNVSIRPEAIRVNQHHTGEHSLRARVLRVAYLGNQTEYYLDSSLGPLFVVAMGTDALYPQGIEVYIDINPVGMVALPATD